jgi:hypothetical protein
MNCIYCKQEINPLRIKALPNTKTCVDCSTTGAKKGVTSIFGEKDHTWNDIVFLEDIQYEKYINDYKSTDLEEDDNPDIE